MLISELKREYKSIEAKIRPHVKDGRSVYNFLRNVLMLLRQYPDLCNIDDYKDLYDETITLLILYAHANELWTRHKPDNQQQCIEHLSDLERNNKGASFKFTTEAVKDYLEYRKSDWIKGEKYTKSRYDFA